MPRPRKLTDTEVQAIIECCALKARVLETMSPRALARRYGVHRSVVYQISVYGHEWRQRAKLTSIVGVAAQASA